MTDTPGQWHDLGVRIISALVLLVLCGGAIWLGGWFFFALIVGLGALVVWEAARMTGARAPMAAAIIAGLGLGLAILLPGQYAVPLLLAPVVVNVGMTSSNKGLLAAAHVISLGGAFAFFWAFDRFGLGTIIWLITVVVVTDIAGYFAGRALGGPKFWPAISPKKTWSGTGAGWVGAGAVGLVIAGPALVAASIALSLASQMGDIFESWVKRRVDIKDSSALIPGHGGVWDRFDGMLGAALALMIIALVFGLSPAG